MPKTVKDLIIEIRNASELIIDLAYSSVLYDAGDIAEEVLELETKFYELLNEIRTIATLSVRRVEDAKKVAAILQIANASQKMSSAAGDKSALVLRGYKLSKDIVKLILSHSEETILKITVPENSQIAGKTLGELRFQKVTGMRVIAIKRDLEWTFDVDKNTRIMKSDVLFIRGDPNMVPKLYEFVLGERRELETACELEIPELDRAVDALIEMKNLSELAVDLAYSSLIYDNEDVAVEVVNLESKVDNLKFEVERNILLASKKFEDPSNLILILEIAQSAEQIADGAREIAEVLLKRMELPPIFRDAMKRTDEVLSIVMVRNDSRLQGKTLGEARVETSTGMHVIAIKRKGEWITRPTANTRIFAEDILIAKGPRDGEKELVNLCSAITKQVP
ncbi:MAG: TrkA C-terminal domain-containing protein [Archaeoglobaceae archaeon]|nr:potassium channel protein [Archaeoglobaceae archaeon]MDW7990281.1 TrkA C-terminal domain-containing protein [Archaeoglobaceae archaeon]